MGRPIQFITDEEFRHFQLRHKGFVTVWKDMAPILRTRDSRGVKRSTMAWGWLACAAYVSQELAELIEFVELAHRKDLAEKVNRLKRHMGIDTLE